MTREEQNEGIEKSRVVSVTSTRWLASVALGSIEIHCIQVGADLISLDINGSG